MLTSRDMDVIRLIALSKDNWYVSTPIARPSSREACGVTSITHEASHDALFEPPSDLGTGLTAGVIENQIPAEGQRNNVLVAQSAASVPAVYAVPNGSNVGWGSDFEKCHIQHTIGRDRAHAIETRALYKQLPPANRSKR